MFGFGIPEMAIILVIVLLVFGTGKLPEAGRALGQSIRNFKSASEGKENPDPDDKPRVQPLPPKGRQP